MNANVLNGEDEERRRGRLEAEAFRSAVTSLGTRVERLFDSSATEGTRSDHTDDNEHEGGENEVDPAKGNEGIVCGAVLDAGIVVAAVDAAME